MSVPGLVAVSSRALERTVAAIAAHRLGVGVSDVSVRVTDEAGLLAVSVASAMRLSPLRSPDRSGTRGVGVLSRIAEARSGIRDDIRRIAGSEVRTVTVSITRAVVLQERRVR